MRYLTGMAAGLLVLALGACGEKSGDEGQTEASVNQVKPNAAVEIADREVTPPAIEPKDPDPYAWLEDVEGEKALKWVRKHNTKTRDVLEQDPRFEPFKAEALEILAAPDRIPSGTYRGGHVYNFWQDKEHVRGIWRRTTLESYRSEKPKWDVLLDIDKLAEEENENWVFEGVNCLPPAYDRCLVQLSRGGTDASVFREWDVPTRAFVNRGFKIPEAKSGVDWLDRDTLLVGTDWGEGSLTTSGYPRVIKRWKRGSFLTEALPVAEGEPGDVAMFPSVLHRPEGSVAIISQALDFFNSAYLVMRDNGTTIQLPVPIHAEFEGVFQGKVLFVLRKAWALEGKDGESRNLAQGALIAFDLDRFLKTEKLPPVDVLFTPDERSSIRGVATSRDRLIVSLLNNVTSEMVSFRLEDGNWSRDTVKIPSGGNATVASADDFNNVVFVNFESYLDPDSLLQLNMETGEIQTIKSLPDRFDAKGLIVERFEAKSRDGTMIPYSLVRPKSAKADGTLPTILYGYGGFEIPLTPAYRSVWGKLWLEKGGAFVIANIRGGGEFGPRWHEAGLKLNRQRVYDDFASVAEDLIARKVTSSRHLGIMGASNGGLLVGVAFTQQPELYHAVVCKRPLLDMIRYVDLPPGASWIGEYGNPEIPEERAVLASYSPYHNLRRDAGYPKVYIHTTTKDDRVHPGHARKLAARMEEMGHDLYYYENTEGGHSQSANLIQEADNTALEFVYLARRLMDESPDSDEETDAAETDAPDGKNKAERETDTGAGQ